MMGMIWVVLLVALTGSHLGQCSPVRPSPQTYPHDDSTLRQDGWGAAGAYAAVPALAFAITAVVLLLGCTWCYRHKDCKPNEGADNQLFTATATHLHEARRVHPPDSGFSEPVNNNISEDNNNGPISLREMQNIANNNATAYIVSENEERNRVSRESVVEFEPLPSGIRVADPLEHCADWFGDDDFPRNGLQYLREIGRGWFGRVVEGEIEDGGSTSTVAVKILNQNASLEDKARFLDEARMYRDVQHENILAFVAKCLQEDPWMLIFELCSMDLQQYLITNRPKMAILNEAGVPLRLMCDVTSALVYLHARGFLYGNLWSGSVLVRGSSEDARGVLGRYALAEAPREHAAPETREQPLVYTVSSESWSLGALLWETCAWGAAARALPAPPPALPVPYRTHLYQVMQLCWNPQPEGRPTASQVHALLNHLYTSVRDASSPAHDDGYASSDFEERWQRLKPNTIPKLDEHVAIVHAPSTSMASHFTFSHSENEFHTVQDSLSVDMDTAVSRSSSIMSDKDPLSTQIKSESLTNLHGSLEDVRNIYLTHNETPALECHQGNIALEEAREKEQDRSDASMDPWLKEIIAGSQDDVSYYKDVNDVIKNLDNILNSEKTSSSESSHQASPSRDNLSLDCKKDYPMQSSMVKSPGITNFQNILDAGFSSKSENDETCEDDDLDRDTIGTLSHSFERHSEVDTASQHTLENLTPDTPIKDVDIATKIEVQVEVERVEEDTLSDNEPNVQDTKLPNENKIVSSDSKILMLKELCVTSIPSASDTVIEQLNVRKDCQTSCDSNIKEISTDKEETKSIDDVGKVKNDFTLSEVENKESNQVEEQVIKEVENVVLPQVDNNVATNLEDQLLEQLQDSELHAMQVTEDVIKPDLQSKVSSIIEEVPFNDLIKVTESLEVHDLKEDSLENDLRGLKPLSPEETPEPVQTIVNEQNTNILKEIEETEIPSPLVKDDKPSPILPLEIVQSFSKEAENAINPDSSIEETVNRIEDELLSEKVNNIFEENLIPITENGNTEVQKSIVSKLSEPEIRNDVMHNLCAFLTEERKLASLHLDKSPNIELSVKKQLDDHFESLTENKNDPSVFYTNNISQIPNTANGSITIDVIKNIPEDLSKELHKSISESMVNKETIEPEIDKVNNMDVSQNVQDKLDIEVNDLNESKEMFKINDQTSVKDGFVSQETDFPKLDINTTFTIENLNGESDDINKENVEIDHFEIEHDIFPKTLATNKMDLYKSNIISEHGDEIVSESNKNHQNFYNDSDIEEAINIVDEHFTSIITESNSSPQVADETLPIGFEFEQDTSLQNDKDIISVDDIKLHFDENLANSDKLEEAKFIPILPTSLNTESITSVDDCKHFEDSLETLASFAPVKTDKITSLCDIKNIDERPTPNLENLVEESRSAVINTEHKTSNDCAKQNSDSKNTHDSTITSNKETLLDIVTPRSDNVITSSENSTEYMDLTTNATNQTNGSEIRAMQTCLEDTTIVNTSSLKHESTEYLDLPNIKENDIKETDNFLQMEINFNSNNVEVVSSTPLASDTSADVNNTIENSAKEGDSHLLSETKIPDTYAGLSLTKLEQKYVPENLSPFESPTKSHHTDTYDENSSVVLGPFENCTLELFKGVKSTDLVELPKEELLAFSSNFSEINLETPSPLRDGNFLIEVPDLVDDDVHFDDIQSISEKPASDPQTESDSGNSGTQKRVSPSTPPNSPGVFLASTSQQKYLVEIDLTDSDSGPDRNLRNEIQQHQMEIDFTEKIAEAENENNMNLEYSGPLVVEGIASEEGLLLRDGPEVQESFLAGNGGSLEDIREHLTLDEECVRALRNELELKLPLAQVASIEPASDGEWSSELPPPPELVVNYPGALSPIAEETGQQLSAYENDAQWNASLRTESSESYPEPCNNSTDDVTELPTGAHHSTYTLQNNTYTCNRDLASSREITMSADSLNASPYKNVIADPQSPIDDRTYTKEEEKESLERISQVSPFLLSPTTDTSDNLDNATGVSTLSKTTLPTDAKLSKPSEALSKATSIDSWCSNDTLYNVEENFDDLALDPDLPQFEAEQDEGNSESTDTLTHNEDDKEVSHCSTYIVHDSKSDACETFSPDSITANDNHTYTKAKTDIAATTSIVTTEINDSTKNTQTKDLAYGTLVSELPSYSKCTTEVASGLDWKLAQPELVRKSPNPDNADVTPPKMTEDKLADISSPQLAEEPSIRKMDSVEMSCLQDQTIDDNRTDVQNIVVQVDSPNYYYSNMTPSVTSTPMVDLIEDDNVEAIPMTLPIVSIEMTGDSSNFMDFQLSAEGRPQSSTTFNKEAVNSTEILLEGDSKTLSRNSNTESSVILDRTPTYSDFEISATSKPQDVQSEEFRDFETSVRSRPQDLSSLIAASTLLLNSERLSSDVNVVSTPEASQLRTTESQQNPPKNTNLDESHNLVNYTEPIFLSNYEGGDDTEQPHSIIITESNLDGYKDSPNRTFDSHENNKRMSYDSHSTSPNVEQLVETEHMSNGEVNIPENETNTEESLKQTASDKTDVTPQTTFLNNEDVTETSQCNGSAAKFATVNFLNETFEELIESNVDDGDGKDLKNDEPSEQSNDVPKEIESPKQSKSIKAELQEMGEGVNGVGEENGRVTSATEEFLQNEKKFCQLDSYLPMMSDIRFTGPGSEIMSTSFTQDSPTDPTSPDNLQQADTAADILKEWDSDTESHTSNSSSGEFIWKDGDGHETAVVPTTHFDHQRSQSGGGQAGGSSQAAEGGSSSSASGSEGDEVEFVPSSWDCRAAPAKSSLRSLEQTTPDNKKRVVFKRQKYHCVYEYPREVADVDAHSPAYLPDLSTYSEWDRASAEEASLGYGQLFGAPDALDLYPLRAGIAFGPDYDEDFFISSSARPFESLGIMSTTSQFFPGKHMKPSLLERDLSEDLTEEFPPPPSPLPTTTMIQKTPSLDFTTPDSGVEDITPGSTTDEDFKKKIPDSELTWRPVDSASSSESVSPSSPGGEALGGLRHTRDKLKLDLPPSPHIPSPRHSRVFNFVLDKPKRREERVVEIGTTPLVMTDETPIVTTALPLQKDCEEPPAPEPTFSTFGKSLPKTEPEQKLILTDDVEQDNQEVVKVESPKAVVEAVKGEGTVLDSGDEDSGIESSSKATLERKTNVS